MRLEKTKRSRLQDIVKLYRDAGEPWPASSHDIAIWAVRNREYAPSPSSVIDKCAAELARAMREEMFQDPQGRRVRKKHALRKPLPDGRGQLTVWIDLEDAEPGEIEIAFQQRRGQILGDCRQLKTDVDSFNENNPQGATIQMVFDFTDDLAELEQPTYYPGIPS